MTDSHSHDENERDGQGEHESVDPTAEQVADAIAEIIVDSGLQLEADEAITITKEMLEEFTSPLMIQRAAGATSSVSITASPAGGVESGRSIKVSNLLVNLKTTAFALPSTLPALLAVYERNESPDHVRIAMAAVFALYGWLKVLSAAFKIPLTKQTAGVLRVMWKSTRNETNVVPHDGLLERVNSGFEEYKWQPINAEELLSLLETLEKIGCIERDAPYNSILTEHIQWRLKEKVTVTY
jgi:hypothetical protein